jgi:hypothetical protein
VEDLFTTYPLDGLQWGAERVGPFSMALFRGTAPFCFCQHCQAAAQAQGVDVGRARQGMRALHAFVSGLLAGAPAPADGVQVTLLRLLLRHPEIMAWERLWREGKEALVGAIYGAVKAIRPQAQVGRHLDHQQSTWDPIFRAECETATVAATCDFIKPIVYHDIAGPRIRWWYVDRLQKTVLQELSAAQSLELFYDVMGYDKQVEPGIDALGSAGLSPDYVYRVTRRLLEGTGGRAAVYPGIGFDVPWGLGSWHHEQWEHFPSDPEKVYQATCRAFDAGAQGIVVSREYDEMRLPNLRAIGRAIAEVRAAG